MQESIELRILDPLIDYDLFAESFGWRPSPKKHVGTNRASFETYISLDPNQVVIGAFNGSFLASFILYEFEATRHECHFTSKRGVPKKILIQAGEMVRDAAFKSGAMELCAWINERNKPLIGYVEALGFVQTDTRDFDGRVFNRYAVEKTVDGLCHL